MDAFLALLLKIWPLLAAGAAGFGVILRVLWSISAGVTTTVNTLTAHAEKHAVHESKINKLSEDLHRVDARVVAIETHLKET
jgi:hypothetical protein